NITRQQTTWRCRGACYTCVENKEKKEKEKERKLKNYPSAKLSVLLLVCPSNPSSPTLMVGSEAAAGVAAGVGMGPPMPSSYQLISGSALASIVSLGSAAGGTDGFIPPRRLS